MGLSSVREDGGRGGWNPAYTPLHSMKKIPGKSW